MELDYIAVPSGLDGDHVCLGHFLGAASLVFGVVGSIVSLLFGTALLGGLIALVARAFGHKDSPSHIVQNDADSVR